MRMRMKSPARYVPVMVVMAALLVTNSAFTGTPTPKPTTPKPTTWKPTTPKPTTPKPTTPKPTTWKPTTPKPTTWKPTTPKPTTPKPTTPKPTTPKPTTWKPTTPKPTTPRPTTPKPTTPRPTTPKPTTPRPTTPKPTTRRPTTWRPTTTPNPWTTGPSGLNLNGKMFTLSSYGGGISFYPPSFYPSSTPYATHRYTTRHYTTAAPTRGVSVCLRYLTDGRYSTIFKLSPSNTPLTLTVTYPDQYTLSFGGYYSLSLQPNIRFWSHIDPDIWTRVCLTVDTRKNVAQVFSGSSISIRKMLPVQYVWTGEPVIDFSGIDGQFTDVQVWDYPLLYKEVFNYMTNGFYVSYQGSVLTWSSIRYSPRGNTLLEDVYNWKGNQPISSRRRGSGCRPEGGRKTRRFFYLGERKEREQM